MNLEKMAEKYRDAGYSERNADARECDDKWQRCDAQHYRECETRYGRPGFGFYQIFIGR